jgi:integrase
MSADPARVAAAWQLLTHLGVTLADLQGEPGPGLPTLAEYLPQVIAAAGPGARRTYGTYWNRMAAAWGERALDTIAASDIEAMQRQITATARSRRNSRSGRHAGEHVIAAARAIYNRAIADGLIDAAASPAHRVVKPRRLPSTRRALTPHEVEQINLAARTTGNDVILDALLLRLHTETACRRGGALGLRLADLDTDRGLVRLTEKGATLRWQPITLDLAAHLDDHARTRGAVLPTDPLLRYRTGQEITSRRYDHL